MVDVNLSRLNAIEDLIDTFRQKDPPILLSTSRLLDKIVQVANPDKQEEIDKIIISCIGRITPDKNGVGFVFEEKGKEPFSTWRTINKECTWNEISYHSIYLALTQFCGMRNSPGCLIEIRNDNPQVISNLENTKDEENQNLCESILDLVFALPFPVLFSYRPAGSSEALEEAEKLATKKEQQ